MSPLNTISFLNFAHMRFLFATIFIMLITTAKTDASHLNDIDSLQNQLLIVHSDEKVMTLIALSEAYRNIGFTDCLKYGLQARKLSNEIENKKLEALSLKSLGISNYFSGDMDIANDYYKKSYNIYTEIKDKKGQANCLNNIGIIYEEWAEFDTALWYYTESLKIEEELDNKEGIAISLIQIGNINYHRNSFQEAIDNYYRALLISREINDIDGIAYAYNSIGIIYGKWGKYDKAVEYYTKAVDLFNETNNKRSLSQALTNLGEIYNFEYKEYKTALKIYNEALMLKKSLEDKVGVALLYNNIGTLYANMEDGLMAIQYFEKSLKFYQETGTLTGVVMVNYNIGELYRSSDDINKATSYLQTSLKMAINNGQVDFINSCYESLIHCYAKNGNYENFEEYFRLFCIGKDTLIAKLNYFEMSEMEAKYSIEANNIENRKVQLENLKMENEVKKYKLLFTGFGALAIIVLFSYLLFLRIRTK